MAVFWAAVSAGGYLDLGRVRIGSNLHRQSSVGSLPGNPFRSVWICGGNVVQQIRGLDPALPIVVFCHHLAAII